MTTSQQGLSKAEGTTPDLSAKSVKQDASWINCSSKDEAKKELRRCEEHLPRRQSAYRPSGKMPASGWKPLLTTGLLYGTLSGAAGGGVAVVVAAVLVRFLPTIYGLSSSLGSLISMVVGLWYFVFLLAAVVGVFALPGFASVGGIENSIKNAKCRNIAAASTISVVSSTLATCVLWAAIVVGLGFFAPGTITTGGLELCFALALIASGVISVIQTAKAVNSQKCCETCECYMTDRVVANLDYEASRKAVHELVEAGSVFSTSPAKPSATVRRFQCSRCDNGYTELEVMFSARWPRNNRVRVVDGVLPGGGKYDKLESRWIAFSQAMGRRHFETLSFGAPESSGDVK